MSTFELDERLATNPLVAEWELSSVLLRNDSRFPWLILVPRIADVTEIFELSAADQRSLMAEIARASAVLKSIFSPDKINIGALGHHVSQLHVHIIGRNKTDPLWPDPVWGPGERAPHELIPYSPDAMDQALTAIRNFAEAS